VSQVIGMDKGAVSRCFKTMHLKGLIALRLQMADARMRIAVLTAKGRALHDQIRGVALERERALLSVLSRADRDRLIHLLKRLRESLPEVERATARYIAKRRAGRS
jgi:DNA-binding MarR family transcriptional regulator